MQKRMKIHTADLQLGMYVSQLDRPWLETPFLFKGFEIRDQTELKQLRQFCQHVYVDPDRGTVSKDRVLAVTSRAHAQRNRFEPAPRARTRSRSLASRLLRTIGDLDPTGFVAARVFGPRHYRNSVPTRTEAPHAIRAYDAAMDAASDVFYQVQKGAGLDVDRLQGALRPLVESILRNQDSMAWLVYLRKRDEYAQQHSIAAAIWAVVLGCHLGFDRDGLDTLALGGMLLDVGMGKFPEEITGRRGPLSTEEQKAVRRHVEYGVRLARSTPGLKADVIAMIESHHERADGTGYPAGLKGGDIPVFGRVAGLVDCYDAMTTQRPWRPARSPYDAIRELNAMADTKFQKEMVEQFVQALGMFPTGSLVELNTGEIAIVVEQNRVRRLRPKLMAILDTSHQPYAQFRTVDLGSSPSDEHSTESLWIVRGHDAGAFGVDPKNFFVT